MLVPEHLADVRQLEPGVDQNALAVTGGDKVVEVPVAFFVRLKEMPGGDMQRAHPGGAPPCGEIVQVHSGAIRGIEEGPQTSRAERRIEAQIGERVQQVWKALIALLA